MPQQLLNGAEVSSVRQQMRGKRVAQRMRMKVPLNICHPHVFFHEPANRSLRQSTSRIVEKHGLGVRRALSLPARRLFLYQQFVTQTPIIFECFLRFRSVGNDALFVALATNAQDSLFLIDINEV